MAPFADFDEQPYAEPVTDPEAPEADAAEQHQEEDPARFQEKPQATPPLEASEADTIEQDEEVPLDDEYEDES